MAQQSVRRGRENQGFPQCFKHALGDMDQARELPYRPAAAQRRIRGRTDGSIRLRATMILKFSLARKGASTDGKLLRTLLGNDYVGRLFNAYAGRVPAEADLVMYWFEKTWDLMKVGKLIRAGL